MLNFDPEHDALPPFSVRVSRRARHVRLRVSARDGVQVVVPSGFDQRQLPELLRENRRWLSRAVARMKPHHEHLQQQGTALPDQLELPSVAQSWRIHYRDTGGTRVRVLEVDEGVLVVSGPLQQQEQVRAALVRWLQHRARLILGPWLARVSQQTGLPFHKTVIRAQRTRWGSCSVRKHINLNYKLILLPPAQVEYILLHELCHTVHMNHSPAYWALVARYLPGYKVLDRAMNHSWRHIPAWLS